MEINEWCDYWQYYLSNKLAFLYFRMRETLFILTDAVCSSVARCWNDESCSRKGIDQGRKVSRTINEKLELSGTWHGKVFRGRCREAFSRKNNLCGLSSPRIATAQQALQLRAWRGSYFFHFTHRKSGFETALDSNLKYTSFQEGTS
jgi:hypothetical protein